MGKKRITEMSGEEFDSIIETYIKSESKNMGEIDAQLFYEALEGIFAAEPTTVELEGHIADSQLQLHPFPNELPGVRISDNEIIVNNIRFVIHLRPEEL